MGTTEAQPTLSKLLNRRPRERVKILLHSRRLMPQNLLLAPIRLLYAKKRINWGGIRCASTDSTLIHEDARCETGSQVDDLLRP